MGTTSGGGTVAKPTPRGLLRFVLRLPVVLYRLRLGWMLSRRFLLLIHTGRKSGVQHETVLEVLRYDRWTQRCIIASGWGEKAQWFRNVVVNDQVRYTLGARERAGVVNRLSVEDGERELREYGKRHPTSLRKLAQLMIGEKFDGGDEEYRNLASRVPLLELSPQRENGRDA